MLDRPIHSVSALFTGEARQASLEEAVEAFLRVELIGRSDDTKTWYRRKLGALCESLGSDKLLADLMEADLLEYYAELDERDRLYCGLSAHPETDGHLSAYTLHGHVRAIKRFTKWLYQKGVLAADVGMCLKLPRLPRNGRKGISEANLRSILEASKEDPRDHALLLFLESTGVRRGGIEDLRLSDIDLDHPAERLRRRASVREKGEKERTVIFSKAALEALVAWIECRPEIDDDHVFLGRSPGQPWHALTAEGISAIITRYKKRLGLVGKCSPHEWRHRWARNRLHKGMELSQVSQLLGHEDVAITVRFYGQFDIDQLQEAYDRYADSE